MNGKPDKLTGDEYDDKGWTPVHHAAYEGYFRTVSRILDSKLSQLEVETLDKLQVTPLWLAFSAGKIETVSMLLFYNADVTVTDNRNVGIIEIAIRNKHTKIVKHLLAKHPELGDTVWQHIVEYTTLDCLHDEDGTELLSSTLNIILAISREAKMITLIKSKGIFEKVILLYKPDVISQHAWMERRILVILQNVCEDSSNNVEKKEVVALLNILPSRLVSENEEEVFHIILAILKKFVHLEYFKELMMLVGKCNFLIKFLKHSHAETLKISTLHIIRKSIQGDLNIQNYLHDNGLLGLLLGLSTESESEQVKVDCIKTMRKSLENNETILPQLLELELFGPLQHVLDLKSKSAVKEVCKFIAVTTVTNSEMQSYYIKADAIRHLSKFFKTFKEDAMYEWIIQALWEIGGGQHEQKLLVAKSVESRHVMALVTSNSSPTLQFYGCEILRILMRIGDQSLHSFRETIMLHLLNFLKCVAATNEKLLSTFKTMQCLCTHRGYRPIKTIQKMAIDRNAIQALYQVGAKSDSPYIMLESMETVASILMCNPNEISMIKKEIGLPLNNVLQYVNHEEPMIRSKVCHVLGFFLLTNQHHEILHKRFQLPLSYFQTLLEVEDGSREYLQVSTAFQLITLKDIISESTPAETTMKGIELLQSSLEHPCSEIVAIAANYVSGLSQYCSGLRAAFNSAGFMNILCNLLYHEDETVKTAVAVTIATLARDLQGEIILLKRCRKEGVIIGLIEKWIQFMTLPAHFMDKWMHYKTLKN